VVAEDSAVLTISALIGSSRFSQRGCKYSHVNPEEYHMDPGMENWMDK